MDERLATHLVRRLQREKHKEAIGNALEAGILATASGESAGAPAVFVPGPVLEGLPPSAVARRLAQHKGDFGLGDPFGDCSFALPFPDDGITGVRTGRKERDKKAAGNPPPPIPELLRLVRRLAPPLRPADVAVVLLLAQGVARTGMTLAAVLARLRPLSPILAVTAQVSGFEDKMLGLMMQGLILPRSMEISDGFQLQRRHPPRFSGSGDLRMIVFAGARCADHDEDEAARKLGLAAETGLPILGLAEEKGKLPPLLEEAAALVIDCGALTPRIVAGTITAVLGEAAAETEIACDCSRLGLADLALAIRPGRTAAQAITLLARLAKERHALGQGGAAGNIEEKGAGGWSRRKDDARDKTTGSTLIQPVKITEETTVDMPAHPDTDPGILRVESLSGFGAARDWALDLKADLARWQQGRLGWEEMNTKLLLSGPPGTGKTSFARALCNTLQIPLIATSVATWLEPGYLGDVVRRMRRAFAEAEGHAPAILFIDEFDGIGRRGRSRDHDEYWTTVVNRLLELLDGPSRTNGVIVVGATNNPAAIDPALLRSGRMENHIAIPLPDTEALIGIFRHHLKTEDLHSLVASSPEAFLDAATPSILKQEA